ncbi:MAG TPA: LEA type 2 family protein [Anaeromyxobacteraceae bacterium]|nr:LEA type 2 family protein [Anaeromyxobacteraceae bacterium]
MPSLHRGRRPPARPLAAAAAALALSLLPGCSLLQSLAAAGIERPRLTFETWSADLLDLEGVTITLRYRLDNPNSFGLDLDRLAYKLEVEGKQVVEGNLPAGVHLAPKGATPLAVPVRLRWKDLPGFGELLLTRSDVGYRVSGVAGVGSPVGPVELPFEHRDRLALPRLPGVRLEGVSVREASLTNLSLDVRLRVENGNAFPLPVGALTYGLRVGDQDLVAGGSHPLASVPPHGHATVAVPVRVSVTGAASAVARLLKGAELRMRGLADYGAVEVPVEGGTTVTR